MKVTKNKASTRTSGAKQVQKKATKAAAPTKKAKSDRFGGTTKKPADKPAAVLPRSAFANTEAFKKAARTSRDVIGVPGGIGERPIVRPMYGLPIPIPLPPHMKDKGLEAGVKDILNDRKINLTEVEALIKIAGDNGGLNKTEKADLKRLMSEAGHFFDLDALKRLQRFVSNEAAPLPPFRPMYGLPFPIPLPPDVKDKKLKDVLPAILRDRTISADEVEQLITVAKDNRGVTKQERADLERIYHEAQQFFTPDAHRRLGQFLGLEPVIRPLYGLPFVIPLPEINDKSLKEAAKGILADRTVSVAEVDALIAAAKDNRGLSKTERDDLNRLLSTVGSHFDPAAKAKLEGFLAGHDGLAVTQARRGQILSAFNKANLAGALPWAPGLPLGVRMVEVPLFSERHPDGFTYTALVPVGALAPGAPTTDPNKVDNAWIRKTGGLAGLTEYAHVNL